MIDELDIACPAFLHKCMFDWSSFETNLLDSGASLQRQGKLQEAIKYHSMVLAISKREGEESGNTEAYGAIADCYTELGDLEQAAKFYDKYIARLETDWSVSS